MPGGVVTWKCYNQFRLEEAESGFRNDAFGVIIPRCIETETHAKIVYNFFDLMASIATHGRRNGLGARKLCRLAGFWAFDLRSKNTFSSGLSYWSEAAEATNHLFLAFLRLMEPPEIPGSMNPSGGMPKPLYQFLKSSSAYPPKSTLEKKRLIAVPMVTLEVSRLSASPMVLLKRIAKTLRFDNPPIFHSEDDFNTLYFLFNDPESIEYKISPESLRIVREISQENSILTDHELYIKDASLSYDNRGKTWSKFYNHAHIDPGTGEVGQPFQNYTFDDQDVDEVVNCKVPSCVKYNLPYPKDSSQSKHHHHHRKSSAGGANGSKQNAHKERTVTAKVSQIAIDDFFVWVWMSSLSMEQTEIRKGMFGRSVIVELEVEPGEAGKRWVIVEEIWKETPPPLDQVKDDKKPPKLEQYGRRSVSGPSALQKPKKKKPTGKRKPVPPPKEYAPSPAPSIAPMPSKDDVYAKKILDLIQTKLNEQKQLPQAPLQTRQTQTDNAAGTQTDDNLPQNTIEEVRSLLSKLENRGVQTAEEVENKGVQVEELHPKSVQTRTPPPLSPSKPVAYKNQAVGTFNGVDKGTHPMTPAPEKPLPLPKPYQPKTVARELKTPEQPPDSESRTLYYTPTSSSEALEQVPTFTGSGGASPAVFIPNSTRKQGTRSVSSSAIEKSVPRPYYEPQYSTLNESPELRQQDDGDSYDHPSSFMERSQGYYEMFGRGARSHDAELRADISAYPKSPPANYGQTTDHETTFGRKESVQDPTYDQKNSVSNITAGMGALPMVSEKSIAPGTSVRPQSPPDSTGQPPGGGQLKSPNLTHAQLDEKPLPTPPPPSPPKEGQLSQQNPPVTKEEEQANLQPHYKSMILDSSSESEKEQRDQSSAVPQYLAPAITAGGFLGEFSEFTTDWEANPTTTTANEIPNTATAAIDGPSTSGGSNPYGTATAAAPVSSPVIPKSGQVKRKPVGTDTSGNQQPQPVERAILEEGENEHGHEYEKSVDDRQHSENQHDQVSTLEHGSEPMHNHEPNYDHEPIPHIPPTTGPPLGRVRSRTLDGAGSAPPFNADPGEEQYYYRGGPPPSSYNRPASPAGSMNSSGHYYPPRRHHQSPGRYDFDPRFGPPPPPGSARGRPPMPQQGPMSPPGQQRRREFSPGMMMPGPGGVPPPSMRQRAPRQATSMSPSRSKRNLRQNLDSFESPMFGRGNNGFDPPAGAPPPPGSRNGSVPPPGSMPPGPPRRMRRFPPPPPPGAMGGHPPASHPGYEDYGYYDYYGPPPPPGYGGYGYGPPPPHGYGGPPRPPPGSRPRPRAASNSERMYRPPMREMSPSGNSKYGPHPRALSPARGIPPPGGHVPPHLMRQGPPLQQPSMPAAKGIASENVSPLTEIPPRNLQNLPASTSGTPAVAPAHSTAGTPMPQAQRDQHNSVDRLTSSSEEYYDANSSTPKGSHYPDSNSINNHNANQSESSVVAGSGGGSGSKAPQDLAQQQQKRSSAPASTNSRQTSASFDKPLPLDPKWNEIKSNLNAMREQPGDNKRVVPAVVDTPRFNKDSVTPNEYYDATVSTVRRPSLTTGEHCKSVAVKDDGDNASVGSNEGRAIGTPMNPISANDYFGGFSAFSHQEDYPNYYQQSSGSSSEQVVGNPRPRASSRPTSRPQSQVVENKRSSLPDPKAFDPKNEKSVQRAFKAGFLDPPPPKPPAKPWEEEKRQPKKRRSLPPMLQSRSSSNSLTSGVKFDTGGGSGTGTSTGAYSGLFSGGDRKSGYNSDGENAVFSSAAPQPKYDENDKKPSRYSIQGLVNAAKKK